MSPDLATGGARRVGSLSRVLTGRVGLSPIMVGRSAALARLRGVIEFAEHRTTDLPPVALVAGEAGIGKTRLLRETIAGLPADVTVCSALAEPGSLGRPFDVARQLVAADERDPTAAVLERLGGIVASGRVVLLVEDVHWIDADSVAVIDAVARQPWPNLVVVATYRPSDLSRGAPGGDLVLRLERRNEVEQFRLDRLDRAQVSALMSAIAGTRVSSAAVEAVYRRSGGVPFVVEELMRCCGPDMCSDDIVGAQLPWSLEEAVRQQLAGLTPQERSIVEVLAVFGQPAGFEALTSITGFDERELLTHLRGLFERGVVVEPRDDRLWFGHALVAESVTHQLLGRERRRLHEACFETLSRIAPEDHAALAHHAQGAGRFEEIVGIARVGARAYLDRGATFQALRLACEGLGEEPGDPDLLAVATDAAWRLNFLPEALAHATGWLERAPSVEGRIEAMRYSARIQLELGDHASSRVMLDRLVELAEALSADPGAVAAAARAEAAVAQVLMLSQDGDAIRWADRAIAHGEAAGDREVLVHARVERASVLVQSIDRHRALTELRAAAAAAEALGDGVLHSRALNNMLELLPPHGVESRRVREQLRRKTAAIGFDKLGHLNVLWWDAIAAIAEGDLAGYRRYLEEWASWTPSPKSWARYTTELMVLATEEGRIADALALSHEVDLAGHDGCMTEMHAPRLSLAALAHDRQLGRAAFEAILAAEPLADTWWAPGLVTESVAAALALDVPAAEIRTRFVDGYLAHHVSRDVVVAAALGHLAQAEGDHAVAIEAFGRALADPRETLERPVEGSVRLALAQALLDQGDRAGALAEAQRSLSALSTWPGWRRDRTEAMLARLQGTSVRAVGELTARESEVAALIAEGLTNGQLAERLFISPKTAAVHVSNILAKLGLASRAEVAAWAVRHELPIAG